MRTFLALLLAIGCGASRPAPSNRESPPPPVPVAACDKLGGRLSFELRTTAQDHFMIEARLASRLGDDDARRYGVELPVPDTATGRLDREQLRQLCSDSRVQRIELAPEMRPMRT